ncbi:MAG: hypothetical protein GY943_03455 [Chloroflexi bacterium]|nr:hypothetical protein [Chloroflexota bacterium]
MPNTPITAAQIDQLLSFLPAFKQPNRSFLLGWQGLAPTYPKDVVAFYKAASANHWMDFNYQPATAGKMVQDDVFIAQATLDEIKTMLTFCVRGERFSDGHWATMLENGRIQAILHRLQFFKNSKLLTSFPDSAKKRKQEK